MYRTADLMTSSQYNSFSQQSQVSYSSVATYYHEWESDQSFFKRKAMPHTDANDGAQKSP